MMWDHKTPGIPDSEFERAERVPITKEEVRAIQISKARLNSGDTVYDVGCGSGSVSVEAGLQVEGRGRVFAIDIDPDAVTLTKRNLAKFAVGTPRSYWATRWTRLQACLPRTAYLSAVPAATRQI